MTHKEWLTEGTKRFGEDQSKWRFVCPSCGHITSVLGWKNAGAPESAVAYSCVGRWTGAKDIKTFKKRGGPCTYAGGGLIGMNPVKVDLENGKSINVFAFAEAA